MQLAIMANLIGNEKSGLSTALSKSAGAHVVQPRSRSGILLQASTHNILDSCCFLRRDLDVLMLFFAFFVPFRGYSSLCLCAFV
jgi:hypothetical protein